MSKPLSLQPKASSTPLPLFYFSVAWHVDQAIRDGLLHRTSCRCALANQVRLVLHTGAFWLMLGLRDAIPAPQPLPRAEFSTLRIRLIKIGARIVETVSRVRIAFAAAHPEVVLFANLARCLQPAGP